MIMAQNASAMTHCKADRKKSTFTDIVARQVIELRLHLAHVIDFSCFKAPRDCDAVLGVIDKAREAGLLSSEALRYVFISTDSTYDASTFLLDSHQHTFVPPAFMKADRSALLTLPKNDRRQMYA